MKNFKELKEQITELRIKVNGGYLIAVKNSDINYLGISVYYESEDGKIIEIYRAEQEQTETNTNNNIESCLFCDAQMEKIIKWKISEA